MVIRDALIDAGLVQQRLQDYLAEPTPTDAGQVIASGLDAIFLLSHLRPVFGNPAYREATQRLQLRVAVKWLNEAYDFFVSVEGSRLLDAADKLHGGLVRFEGYDEGCNSHCQIASIAIAQSRALLHEQSGTFVLDRREKMALDADLFADVEEMAKDIKPRLSQVDVDALSRAVRKELMAAEVQQHRSSAKANKQDALPAGKPKCRLRVESGIEGDYVFCDETRFPVNDKVAALLSDAIDKKGDWVSMAGTRCRTRDIEKLPDCIRELIETVTAKGTRLRADAWLN